MQKKVYSISFSEFSTFLQCPHKWYLTYCLRFPSEQNEELLFGSLIHKTIETIIEKPTLRKKSFLPSVIKNVLKDELGRINDVGFLSRFSNSHWPYTFVKQASELLTDLDFFDRFKDYKIVEVEHKLDGFPIIEYDDVLFVFKGYIDLILQHNTTGKYLFLDWKTSRKKWDIKAKLRDNADFYTQLGFYKYFYALKMGLDLKQIESKFYNLPREESRNQGIYDGILNETYLNYLFEKLQTICKTIYESSYMELDKSKITTKKNFCHRCNFNNETYCNDYDEHQVVI